MIKLFNKIEEYGFKEILLRRKKRLIHSITKRFGKKLFKFYPKLPQNYEFVVLNYSVSGHYALINFFKMCGLNYVRLAKIIIWIMVKRRAFC
uniref:hypothetical protein n=1 Tax=Campylobacter upsaliensis TaxID=28080 RepID=UPI003AF9BC51